MIDIVDVMNSNQEGSTSKAEDEKDSSETNSVSEEVD